MQMKLVGVAPVNFTNNAGETIKGQNIYVLFKDENTNGLKAEKLFLKDGIDLPKDTKLNDMLGFSLREVLRITLSLITNTCTPCLLKQILARTEVTVEKMSSYRKKQ